jgi:outer membrane protein assembly factor BamA
MRRIHLLLLLVLPLAPLAAQESEEPDSEPSEPWRLSYFPYIHSLANDGPVFTARTRYWQPADYEDRVTARASLDAAAGASLNGSRFVAAVFRAPRLRPGWRLAAALKAERLARLGYFGLGNSTEYDKDLVTESNPFLFRARRTRYVGQVEVTREIRGPLQVALRGLAEDARFTALPGPSNFKTDFGDELDQSDFAARLALIYDSRDVEYNTHQGLLLEAGAEVGSGGDGYTRLYSILRGYLTVREGTVVALRLAGSGMGGTPPLNARLTLPNWEYEVSLLGGEHSHRALDTGRLLGKGSLFGNLEVRHDVLPFGDLGALTLVSFADAGRVFEEESFSFTTEDMKVGGGGGIVLRILRSTIITLNFAGGPDGFNFSTGSGWMF